MTLVEFLPEAFHNPELVWYAFATTLGILVHYLKKVHRDDYDWKTYWSIRGRNTALSLIGAFVGFVSLVQSGETSFMLFLLMGYSCDSILNKAIKKAENVNPL